MKKIIKPGGKHNYGWGRNIYFAGRCIIMAYYSMRYGTCAAHIARWQAFSQYLTSRAIKDVQDVSIETIEDVAEIMRLKIAIGTMKTSYAVNLLSTANVVLRLMRSDSCLTVSPRKLIGSRSYIRTDIPAGMDMSNVFAAAEEMRRQGYPSEAQVILQARDLGLRKKEACLLDASAALLEAETTGMISISEGTKGGRGKHIVRHYPTSEHTINILKTSAEIQSGHSCIVPPELTLIQFIRRLDKIWAKVRDEFDLHKQHDLRAAALCRLYADVSGHPAPVMTDGQILASPEQHAKASAAVSDSAGHSTGRSIAAYCGSPRRRS